ncbi:PadR family transcriptional regulator [Nonomuraea sp. SYSU D8015]|uniref:PadR family transcriptional regulator n=1 Tax=Nonomuraea sp. SYSU D8015 TaxID=2593644 RepID=UPI0016607474|nr:helix-turn-helix transcriptional regulator [Nonomuraea sp. SYSU D8015]
MALRMTSTTRAVLQVLQAAASRGESTYGLEICRETQLGSGTVYPILTKFERLGLVRTYWEDDSTEARGPRRRMYELTAEGAKEAERAAQRAAPVTHRLGWVR